MTTLAHSAHWYEGILYLLPVIVVVIVLAVQGRRRGADEPDAGAEPPQPQL